MKCLSFIRLRKFCFLIPLGRGCAMISLILLLFEVIAPPLIIPGPKKTVGYYLVLSYRFLNIIHTLSCIILLISYFVRYSGLVMIFMWTLIFHMIVLPVFWFLELYIWHREIIDVWISLAG
ncbi:hypothetical protein KR200_009647, partial [Drosophila serrata]